MVLNVFGFGVHPGYPNVLDIQKYKGWVISKVVEGDVLYLKTQLD